MNASKAGSVVTGDAGAAVAWFSGVEPAELFLVAFSKYAADTTIVMMIAAERMIIQFRFCLCLFGGAAFLAGLIAH